VLPIYVYGQPVLRRKARTVRHVTEDLRAFVRDMFDTMESAGGIGLAANQVGTTERIVVVDITDMEETQSLPDHHPARKPLVLINPVVEAAEGSWVMQEGCLSIPDIRDEVERAERFVLRYQDLHLKDHEIAADGLFARVVLHEVDHLDGVLFIDHLSGLKRKLLRGRLNKITRGETETEYPVVAGTSAPVHARG
jgi:peptide deformylase